jgi:hypothetical protein
MGYLKVLEQLMGMPLNGRERNRKKVKLDM